MDNSVSFNLKFLGFTREQALYEPHRLLRDVLCNSGLFSLTQDKPIKYKLLSLPFKQKIEDTEVVVG